MFTYRHCLRHDAAIGVRYWYIRLLIQVLNVPVFTKILAKRLMKYRIKDVPSFRSRTMRSFGSLAEVSTVSAMFYTSGTTSGLDSSFVVESHFTN